MLEIMWGMKVQLTAYDYVYTSTHGMVVCADSVDCIWLNGLSKQRCYFLVLSVSSMWSWDDSSWFFDWMLVSVLGKSIEDRAILWRTLEWRRGNSNIILLEARFMDFNLWPLEIWWFFVGCCKNYWRYSVWELYDFTKGNLFSSIPNNIHGLFLSLY